MIVVTGAAGFIGSNLIKGLNARGYTDIIAVDDLSDGHKFVNLLDCSIADYCDKNEFFNMVTSGAMEDVHIDVIFHQGACSDTTEWNGQYMMKNNYEYSNTLVGFCAIKNIPFIYASSAAVYGANTSFSESLENERPLNVYGYSKWMLDQYVRRGFDNFKSQVVGLRYFNVYGPNEQHKGKMASVAFHLHQQLLKTGCVKLFEGSDAYSNGEQRRDFIHVDDVVAINLWLMDHPEVSGIFNVGTGRSQTFNEVANAVIDWHGTGEIEYIPFPEHLKGHYQSFTEADMTRLHQAGYSQPFKNVQEGVKAYLGALTKHNSVGRMAAVSA